MTQATTRFEELSPTTSYVGKAAPGSAETDPVWQIKRISSAPPLMDIRYPNGVDNYNSVWADRATYNYL